MASNEVSSGVSNCYVFKSRLQEYAQKFKLPTPIYETVKEGPSHSSSFRSTVIVNGVRYDSLPGFFNRKAAEQSAAEVALQELAKSSELNQCVSQPVHETGLCKNLLQEYAQKMNYAMPLYHCQRSELHGRAPHFICTVEIGGIKYTGAATRTKKDAEISAGRTALLAIQSESNSNFFKSSTHLTVIPCQKKTLEAKIANQAKDAIKTPKAKKGQFKKKRRKGKNGLKISSVLGSNGNQIEAMVSEVTVVSVENCENRQALGLNVETAASSVEASLCFNGIGEKVETVSSSVEASLCFNGIGEKVETVASSVEAALCLNRIGEKVETTASSVEASLCFNGIGEKVETTASSVEASLCFNGIGEKVETVSSSVEAALCLNGVKEVFGSMETEAS